MRPGRGLKSSSRMVMAESAFSDPEDGARRIEIVDVSGESASGSGGLDAENRQSDQPYAPGRRRRFYLAVHGRPSPPAWANRRTGDKPSQSAKECDFAHWGRSLLARCTNRPSDCGESAERSTTRWMTGERIGCTLAAGNSAFDGASACEANSVARAQAIRSKEATVWSSNWRPPIIGESIAT